MYSESISNYSFSFRTLTLFILVAFASAALFGFSVVIHLKPAQALFGIDAAIQIAFEFVKAVAIAFLIQFLAKSAFVLLQKLESVHTIRNILYYSDALEFDQYIGNVMNKYVLKPETAADVRQTPDQTNLASIVTQANLNRFYGLPRGEIAQLALLAAKQTQSGGITQQQERVLLRGALTMMTSQVWCQGAYTNPVRTLANYNAIRSMGFDPAALDPTGASTGSFYGNLANYGSPYSMRDYQVLVMRDMTNQIEAEAKQAALKELVSPGIKNVRTQTNTITRAMGTVNALIEEKIGKIFNLESQNSLNAYAAVAANTVADVLSSIVVNVIFTDRNARFLAENPYCGVSPATASLIAEGYDGAPDPVTTIPDTDVVGINPYIRVDGGTISTIVEGEGIILSWDAGSVPGDVTISGLGSVGRAGVRGISPLGDTSYTLSINGEPYGVAVVTVLPAPATTDPSSPEFSGTQLELSPSFKVRE